MRLLYTSLQRDVRRISGLFLNIVLHLIYDDGKPGEDETIRRSAFLSLYEEEDIGRLTKDYFSYEYNPGIIISITNNGLSIRQLIS